MRQLHASSSLCVVVYFVALLDQIARARDLDNVCGVRATRRACRGEAVGRVGCLPHKPDGTSPRRSSPRAGGIFAHTLLNHALACSTIRSLALYAYTKQLLTVQRHGINGQSPGPSHARARVLRIFACCQWCDVLFLVKMITDVSELVYRNRHGCVQHSLQWVEGLVLGGVVCLHACRVRAPKVCLGRCFSVRYV